MTVDVQDLDNETLLHIDAENRRQALEDELEFLKQVHEQVKTCRIGHTCTRWLLISSQLREYRLKYLPVFDMSLGRTRTEMIGVRERRLELELNNNNNNNTLIYIAPACRMTSEALKWSCKRKLNKKALKLWRKLFIQGHRFL